MLTQKALTEVLPQGDVSKDIVGWVAKNSKLLEAKFDKKYPRSKSRFNIEVRNTKGNNRVIILNDAGNVKVAGGTYKNLITWQNLRRLGCPASV